MAESTRPRKQSLKDIARRVSTIPPSPTAKPRTHAKLDSMRPVSVSAPPPPSSDQRMRELAAMVEATVASGSAPKPQQEAPAKPTQTKKPFPLPVLAGAAVGLGAIALSVVVITRTPTSEAKPPPAQHAAATAIVEAPTQKQGDVEKADPTEAAEVAEATEAEKTEHVETSAKEVRHGLAKPEPAAPKPGLAAPGKTNAETAVKTEEAPKEAEDEVGEEPGGSDAAEGTTPEGPKGLAGAMADAVGRATPSAEGAPEDDGEKAPAGSIPMTPSQGQVQAALGAVRGAAKGCVAGLEDASRATVTFGSDGRVSGVSVSGAASGKPAASCIRSALGNALVPPFKKSSFTVGLTLRP